MHLLKAGGWLSSPASPWYTQGFFISPGWPDPAECLLFLLVSCRMPSPLQHLTIWSSPDVHPCFISSTSFFTFYLKMHIRDKEKFIPGVKNGKWTNPCMERGDTMQWEHSRIIRKRKRSPLRDRWLSFLENILTISCLSRIPSTILPRMHLTKALTTLQKYGLCFEECQNTNTRMTTQP